MSDTKPLEGLNEKQREAVTFYEGPLLILAGAGSGKTRVLTNRIAWLIGEKGVQPWNILAITFTNKAAGEMRERVNRMILNGADAVWVATFHSTCARILRRYIDCIGYQTNFTIYDADDQKNVMKDVCKKLEINTKLLKERTLLHLISQAKDELVTPEDFAASAAGDFTAEKAAQAYAEYQAQLKANNALDFDDLICKTIELFRKEPEVLDQYRRRFRFIMVDEYQDTNTAQFELIHLLAGEQGNLCVVGDDDQSIYGFRGANIQNILSFEEVYAGTRTVRLEQNYRSTQQILDAANAVIANNRSRKPKKLWTANENGNKVKVKQFISGFEEAQYIAEDIKRKAARGEYSYSDSAVLYRTNAQSRLLEEKLILSNIPYRIYGGINFYARKEIKDILSYLKAVDNGDDDLAVRRIINIPKRGIGAASITKVQAYADINGLSFFEALTRARDIPGIGRSAAKLEDFARFILSLRRHAGEESVKDLLDEILEQTGYRKELEEEKTEEALERLRNIDELISKVVSYEDNAENPALEDFLQEVSLVADIDEMDQGAERVSLMTLHSAKGLEFPNVYMVGMEDGLFPSYMSIGDENSAEALEEERRLCYVGITRAMRDLTLTCAQKRMLRGQVQYSMPSRFLGEIPPEMTDDGREQGMNIPGRNRGGRETVPGSAAGAGRMEAHRQEREAFRKKPFNPSDYKVVKADVLSYGTGDRVEHVKFGRGTVISIIDGGRDYEVSVEFDKAGIKKMFAGFAKLKRIEE